MMGKSPSRTDLVLWHALAYAIWMGAMDGAEAVGDTGALKALRREGAKRLDVKRERDGVTIDEVVLKYEQAIKHFKPFWPLPPANTVKDRKEAASLTGLRELIELGLVEVRPAANDNQMPPSLARRTPP